MAQPIVPVTVGSARGLRVSGLFGELDLASLPALRAVLGDALDQSPVGVVLDFSAVTFMDCCALGVLVEARARLGGRLRLTGVDLHVGRLLKATGMYGALVASEEIDTSSRIATATEGTDVTQDSSVGNELVTVFARMSGFLLSQETVHSALELVTALATETIPESVGAGVTLLRDGAPSTAAASDDVVERADTLQYELDEGPCLSAWRQGEPFRINDTLTETRWPRWTTAVAPLGMRSALTTPMTVSGKPIGAIKVYSREAGAYDDRDARILALFAAQAAILLANMQSHESATRLTDELKVAVRSRDVIGIAKGIVMANHGIDEAAAFTMLAQTSQRSGQAIREVAQEIVDHPRSSEG